MLTAVPLFLTFLPIMAIKPGLIHYFLHKEMPVPSQEYDSCFPFVWWVCAFDFVIWQGAFRFEFSSEFGIFVILLFYEEIILVSYCTVVKRKSDTKNALIWLASIMKRNCDISIGNSLGHQ